jgi:hypothetical protein
MNTIEWISLLSSIGTLLTAIIAACTLFELFRQRRASYKPDLSVLQNRFQLRPNKLSNCELPIEWCKCNQKEGDLFNFASMTLVNVGFGAAKNVTAKWFFDREGLLNEVNELAQKTHQSFYIEKDEHMLSINDKGSGQFMVNYRKDSEEFEYLLPLTQDKKGRKINLPPAYTLLVSSYLSLKIYNNMRWNELEIPNITLDLSYSDIGKGKYTTKHKIQCQVVSIETKEGELSSKFHVLLSEIS